MDFAQELKNIGLNKSEISVYLYLLEHGVSSPAQIAKGVQAIRTNTYNVLQALRDKGLIVRQGHGKRFVYGANDPAALLERVEREKTVVERLLPDLRALYKKEKNKPSTKYYYGLEQIKEIFSQTDDAAEILFIISTEKLFAADPEFFKKLRQEFMKKNVFVRDILTRSAGVNIAKDTKEVMRGYYDYRFLPKKHLDLPTSIRIWKDHVALITLEEPFFGMVLTDQFMAQTFRVIFETLWQTGEKE